MKAVMIMNVYIKLKSAGKRKPVLNDSSYILPDEIASLRQLIEMIVRQEVIEFNNRGASSMLVPFLTETEISEQSTVGKIGFGSFYSEKKADLDKAIETAVQGFEDGLFRVVVGDKEVEELDELLELHENDTLTFIRLTFLAGRLW